MNANAKRFCVLFGAMILFKLSVAQHFLSGEVLNSATGEPVAGATVKTDDPQQAVVCDATGKFRIQVAAGISVHITAAGFRPKTIGVDNKEKIVIQLIPSISELDAVVVTGTLKPVKKLESPIPVEVYTPQFFKKNPVPSIFEALQNINGVRPQLNCNVCNTGDIHINGLEGPYTMITIDGMPIVSSLASVYGLFGIPSQLIERVEIVKGPASGLYGSEAIGGLINIITKDPSKAPKLTANVLATNWQEYNADLGVKMNIGGKATNLLGINYFNYQHPFDKNGDDFTDITLQHRISAFNKINFQRKNNSAASIAGRYFYEDRWGGDMRWNKSFRGGDSIYGESIYTSRWELIGNYQLPINERVTFSFSATGHDQNSWYGNIPYFGKQKIVFGQFLWDKNLGTNHSALFGIAGRYNNYDDNSTATVDTLTGKNKPDRFFIPGIFVQDEWKIGEQHRLLTGIRYDYHPVHKNIITPRIAWKWSPGSKQVVRVNAGTGFRVVSLFTEEHAALTGARAVEVKETLKPERSYNININYSHGVTLGNSTLNADFSAWYTYFNNQIIPDYNTDPNKIIYENLKGYSSSKGITLNIESNFAHRLKMLLGFTLQDVAKFDKTGDGTKIRIPILLTEKWSGTWSLSYTFPVQGLTIDYTGNIYGPMQLPLLSAKDPRSPGSPVWSIQNIQVTKRTSGSFEIFAGVKNLLNWTPARNNPFIIARTNDPFDKEVQFDNSGNAIATPGNPYALTFDPTYVYAPNQGIRLFGGMRLNLR